MPTEQSQRNLGLPLNSSPSKGVPSPLDGQGQGEDKVRVRETFSGEAKQALARG